ncbi:MAG TPA: hypothetical protein VF192_12190 [Longimicrobiales bacterium]
MGALVPETLPHCRRSLLVLYAYQRARGGQDVPLPGRDGAPRLDGAGQLGQTERTERSGQHSGERFGGHKTPG